MIRTRSLLGPLGAFVAVVCYQAFCVGAASSINVALQTSFDAAPFLVELLYESLSPVVAQLICG
jgi:hypothetical protein